MTRGDGMKQALRKLFNAGVLAVCTAQVAVAAPEYSKLTSEPWSSTSYSPQVIGNVSANEFWLLANVPSASDPTRYAACALFSSNGTDAGTKKLYELFTGKCGVLSKDRVFKDGQWYFGMTKSIPNTLGWGASLFSPEGEELWVVGSQSATEIVINPGSDGSSPGGFYNDGSTVYFAATTSTSGRELWTTSGTQASTKLFKDINPGTASSNPSHIVYFGGFRYFAADDGVHGTELWRTSGLQSRVELFKNINPKTGAGSNISALFPFEGLLFISANDGVRGQNLWATTGFPQTSGSTAPNETALFKDLFTAKATNPNQFFVDGGKLHFLSDTLGSDGTLQSVLWQSDGTAQGTTVKHTFSASAAYLGRAGSAGLAFQVVNWRGPKGFIVGSTVIDLGRAYYPALVNGSYYFMAQTSTAGAGVYRYDPTALPSLERITNEHDPASSSFIFEKVVATSATHAVERGSSGYFSVVDKSCTSGSKKNPGVCGCSIPDTDSDLDRTPDCIDACSQDRGKTAPGICGCGTSDIDTDSDGIVDCQESCSKDPEKTAPGLCGCGVSDADTDGDGTADCKDECPQDAQKTAAGSCGCGVSDADSDGDKIPDCNDRCPADKQKTLPGTCGCGISDVDTDYDEVADCNEACPNDRSKRDPGVCGCGVSDADSDGDGVANCKDGCPQDTWKTTSGVCGCGIVDTDRDYDGFTDCAEQCPDDPQKQTPGLCGCQKADIDSDRDGTPNCKDGCSDDAAKTAPGVCGCGTPDVDADRDRVADCKDACPTDKAKVAAGSCGCGTSDIDSDKDGTADCKDLCVTDPRKQAPGECGCGVPDQDINKDGVADCAQVAALANTPGAPLIQDGNKTVTVVLPETMTASLRKVTYEVSYRFQNKAKGKTKWSGRAIKKSSSPIVKIGKPKSAIAMRVFYRVTVPGLSTTSPQSQEVTAILK
jgi:ELWxxDGT repeat protein